MKKLFSVILVAGAFVCQGAVAGLTPHVDVTGSYLFPSEENWDAAYGAAVTATFWSDANWALGLRAGIEQWEADEDESSEVTDAGGGRMHVEGGAMDGDAMMIPLGAVGAYRYALSDKLLARITAGISYVLVNSDVTIRVFEGDVTPAGDVIAARGAEDDVEFDDGVVANVDLLLEVPLKAVSFLIGGGYQFDVSKGDATWMDQDIGDSSLEGAYVKAGLQF
ncbi:MAG: hypothetical protein K8T26_14945 [Lentisphaerae bacterium]|nr:hypothetical protein [Lentisphaerota bacterium]